MTENQKLREAFERAAHKEGCTDFRRVGDAYANRRTLRCWRIWQASQAIALPTAAPVGERLTLSAEDVHAAFVKHFPKTRISQAWIGFAAEIAEAIAARASLSAGDAAGEREVVYRCTNCKHIYQDPPTKCDCMPDVQWYEQGHASFDGTTLPTQQSSGAFPHAGCEG